MKKIKKHFEPQELKKYRDLNPEDGWKKGFKSNAGKKPNQDVRDALIFEQKGLCVYCEIDLKNGHGNALSDFRVEHFFPENPELSDIRDDNINYALLWENMFGCCCGGNTKSVIDNTNRYTNPDFSCDVIKENHDWTSELLNPLTDIPSFPLIFDFNEDGEIKVSTKCPTDIKTKAEQTIKLLRLDSERLIKFRKSTIDTLREQLIISESAGIELEDALTELARTFLEVNHEGYYEAFFSTIRWYLADEAEKILIKNNYDG